MTQLTVDPGEQAVNVLTDSRSGRAYTESTGSPSQRFSMGHARTVDLAPAAIAGCSFQRSRDRKVLLPSMTGDPTRRI